MASKQLTQAELKSMLAAVKRARDAFEKDPANEGRQYKTATRDAAAAIERDDSRQAEALAFCVTAALELREAAPNVVSYSREAVELWMLRAGTAPKNAHPWGESALDADKVARLTGKTAGEKAAAEIVEAAKAKAEQHATEAEEQEAEAAKVLAEA